MVPLRSKELDYKYNNGFEHRIIPYDFRKVSRCSVWWQERSINHEVAVAIQSSFQV